MGPILGVLLFGGVPFGATESELRASSTVPLLEQRLADGSRALAREEDVAGYKASRRWIIRDGKVAEGVLLFNLKSDEGRCRNLLQTALSAIEANYKVSPSIRENNSGSNQIKSETWIAALPQGGRIEQRFIYVKLINDCTISGRYFPAPENLKAF